MVTRGKPWFALATGVTVLSSVSAATSAWLLVDKIPTFTCVLLCLQGELVPRPQAAPPRARFIAKDRMLKDRVHLGGHRFRLWMLVLLFPVLLCLVYPSCGRLVPRPQAWPSSLYLTNSVSLATKGTPWFSLPAEP